MVGSIGNDGRRMRACRSQRIDQDDSGTFLAILAPTDRQPAAVPRVPRALPREPAGRRTAASRDALAGRPASVAAAALPRAVRTARGLPLDAGRLAGRADAGDPAQADPARGHQGRDRLCHAGPTVARLGRGAQPDRDPRVAADPAGDPGGRGAGGLDPGQVPGPFEPMADHTDDQAGAGRRAAKGLRPRDAAAAPPRLSAQVGRRLEPAPRGCRRRG